MFSNLSGTCINVFYLWYICAYKQVELQMLKGKLYDQFSLKVPVTIRDILTENDTMKVGLADAYYIDERLSPGSISFCLSRITI